MNAEETFAARPLQTTQDALWQGRIQFVQPLRSAGYRFNLDSVLLAGFVGEPVAERAIDLGAGCGIVGILLLKQQLVSELWAVERQPPLLACLRYNAAENGVADRLCVVAGDLRTAPLPAADLIVFNPPYFEAHAGRASTVLGRDEARRECHGGLSDFVAAAARALRPCGRVVGIVPYGRRAQVHAACERHDLRLARQRAVLAFAGRPPRHLLFEATREAGACVKEAPWVVHTPGGGYASDVTALIDGPPMPGAPR